MNLRRFGTIAPRPDTITSLHLHHPAVVKGHSIFRSKVVAVADAPRLLVSGMNNRKIGRQVQKGAWAGMAIYMLTLEERATCPRSCAMWGDCYGNAMHMARRHRHGPELEARLLREIAFLSRENPRGFVVRLHVLGDFYSVEYARLWSGLLAKHPELHIYGYTARIEGEIAESIALMNSCFPNRCVIRSSKREVGPGAAVVIDSIMPVVGAFICPAETQKSECCSTCGLCWADATRDKAVLFLRHGNPWRQAKPRVAA